MRTDEEFFTQLVSKEIYCPTNEKCIAKSPRIPKAFKDMPISWVHADITQYMTCISRYVCEFVRDRIRELKKVGHQDAIFPKNISWIMNEDLGSDIFMDVIKEQRIYFAENNSELDKILTHNLFSICEVTIRKMGG